MKVTFNPNRATKLFAMSVIAFASVTTPAQSKDQKVKAAFLLNFANYVEWPATTFSDSNTFTIAVVGRDSLNGALESAMDGKSVGGRKVVVKHLRWDQDLTRCQILLVPSGESGNYRKLESLKRSPVLTVGETLGFAQSVGIINFITDSSKVGFEINSKRGQTAGLDISSKLLRLAKVVDHT